MSLDIQDLDDVDRAILPILADDPRKPYQDIANELESKGHGLSGEAVRRRVTKLLTITSGFFLVAPDQVSSELVLVSVTTIGETGAHETVHEDMKEMGFYFVADGFGSFDIYGVATVPSNEEIKDLTREVREHEMVADIEYHVEASRFVDMSKYLNEYY